MSVVRLAETAVLLFMDIKAKIKLLKKIYRMGQIDSEMALYRRFAGGIYRWLHRRLHGWLSTRLSARASKRLSRWLT